MAFVFGLAGMASIGLPGLANFPGEFHGLLLRFRRFQQRLRPRSNRHHPVPLGTGHRRGIHAEAHPNIFQGDLSKASAYATGLQPSERAANCFLVIALAVFGFFPTLVLQFFS